MNSQLDQYEYRIVKISADYVVQVKPVIKWQYVGYFSTYQQAEDYIVNNYGGQINEEQKT